MCVLAKRKYSKIKEFIFLNLVTTPYQEKKQENETVGKATKKSARYMFDRMPKKNTPWYFIIPKMYTNKQSLIVFCQAMIKMDTYGYFYLIFFEKS